MTIKTEAGVTIAPIAVLEYDPNGLIAKATEEQQQLKEKTR